MKRLLNIMLAVLMVAAAAAQTGSLSGLNLYINPGHGGFDSNDRSCWTIPVPDEWTDSAGYWESKSNFVKGLILREMVENAGGTVVFSREQNTSGQRDMPEALARIIGVPTSTLKDYFSGYDNRPSASFDLNAFMQRYPQITQHIYDSLMAGGDRYLSAIAEEANANGVDHFLSIHSNAVNKQQNYLLMLYHGTTGSPTVAQSDRMASLAAQIQIKNELTVWSSASAQVYGDLTFYGDNSGLGVLRPLTVPHHLSEGSFHDYPPETHRLMNYDYCKLEALRMFMFYHRWFNRALPQTGTIAGFVKSLNEKVDELGESKWKYISKSDDQWLPINGATVTLLNEAGDQVLQTYTTDNWYNGIFAFYDLTPGNYKVAVRKSGYARDTTDVTVAAEDIKQVKFFIENIHKEYPDYADPEQAAGTLPLKNYEFEQTLDSVLQVTGVSRMVARNGKLYTLYNNGTVTMQADDMSDAPASLPVPDGVTLTDIGLTADEYPVAMAVNGLQMSIYTWNNNVVSELFSATLPEAVGTRMAVSGARWHSTYYLEPTTTTGQGVVVRYNEEEDTPVTTGVEASSAQSGSPLMIAPDGTVYNGNGTFFRYAGHSYMAEPVAQNGAYGFVMKDVTGGIASAAAVSAVYPDSGMTGTATGYMTAMSYSIGYDIFVDLFVEGVGYRQFRSLTQPVADIYAGELNYDSEKGFSFRLNENASDVEISIENEGETVNTYSAGALGKGYHTISNPFGTEEFEAWSVTASARAVSYPMKLSDDSPCFQYYGGRGIAVDRTPESPFFGRIYVTEATGGKVEDGRTTTTGVYVLGSDFSDVTNQGNTAWNGDVAWGETIGGDEYEWALSHPGVGPDGEVYLASSAVKSPGVYMMDAANPAQPFRSIFDGKKSSKRGTLSDRETGAVITNPVMDCIVLGKGAEKKLYTYDRQTAAAGTREGNIKRFDIGSVKLPWKKVASAVEFNNVANDNHLQNASGEIAYDGHGGFWISQYRYSSTWAVPALLHETGGKKDFNISTNVNGAFMGGMAVTPDGSMLAMGTDAGTVTVWSVEYDNFNTPTLTQLFVINWGNNAGNTLGVEFDAAGNLYIISPSNERLMVYAMPKSNNIYTTRAPKTRAEVEDPFAPQDDALDNVQAGDVTVYPNPASTMVYVEGVQDGTCAIFDLAGRCMMTSAIGNDGGVNVSGLRQGMYIMRVTTLQGEVMTARIIKTNNH